MNHRIHEKLPASKPMCQTFQQTLQHTSHLWVLIWKVSSYGPMTLRGWWLPDIEHQAWWLWPNLHPAWLTDSWQNWCFFQAKEVFDASLASERPEKAASHMQKLCHMWLTFLFSRGLYTWSKNQCKRSSLVAVALQIRRPNTNHQMPNITVFEFCEVRSQVPRLH